MDKDRIRGCGRVARRFSGRVGRMSSVHFRLGRRLSPRTGWYKFREISSSSEEIGCGGVQALLPRYPFFPRLCFSVYPVEVVVASCAYFSRNVHPTRSVCARCGLFGGFVANRWCPSAYYVIRTSENSGANYKDMSIILQSAELSTG